jgi:hypothetical protein
MNTQEWGEVAELNQLEQLLRQPDAVMEPGILEKLRQYVAKGGSPKDVVEMLADNYVGESSFTPADGLRILASIEKFSQNVSTPSQGQQIQVPLFL